VTGVIGGGFLMCGAIAGLAIADVPMAVVACAAFGMLGAATAWDRLRWRLPGWHRPRHSSSDSWWRHPAVLRARAAVARPPWTGRELAALKGEASVERLLATVPQEWRERKYR